MQRNHTNMIYPTNGSQALEAVPVRHLVLIEGGAGSPSPQSPRTYHEQATSRAHRVVTTAQGILAFCVALAVIAAILSASIIRDYALVDARNEAFANVTLEEVVVMPGDSLWQLAESHPVAGVSTADVVSYISESNDLPSANLQVGQHLLVPAC